jgi:hypothetical protein
LNKTEAGICYKTVRVTINICKGIYVCALNVTSNTRRYLENGYKCKNSVQQGAGIGHQWLLVLHEKCSDEQLGSGQAAPSNSHTSQHQSQ